MILQYYQFIRQDDVVRDKEMRLTPKNCSNLVKTKRHKNSQASPIQELHKEKVIPYQKMCTKTIQNVHKNYTKH